MKLIFHWFVLDSDLAVTQTVRDVAVATQMYTEKCQAVGGLLGMLSGGLPADTTATATWLYDRVFSRDPKAVTREALHWLCRTMGLLETDDAANGEAVEFGLPQLSASALQGNSRCSL
jgi:hypothetical protein